MLSLTAIENFHLLRPFWLLGLFPLAYLHWKFSRIYQAMDIWRKVISPHLLSHLTVNTQPGAKVRPYHLLSLLLVIVLVAIAGPSWKKEITPFTEDQAPLVIALELSRSMMAVDQAPTRLERAKQKIRGLLKARQGARTAIIVYAGSAHTALPFTDDAALIELYLESFVPSLMPVDGDNPEKALDLARALLAPEPAAGTVLFLSDGIDRGLSPAFSDFAENSTDQVLVLGFGTDEGGLLKDESDRLTELLTAGTDWSGLRAVTNAAGGSLLRASLNDEDIESLLDLITSNLVDALNEDQELQWHDSGYSLSWVVLLLSLAWFRRGWTVA